MIWQHGTSKCKRRTINVYLQCMMSRLTFDLNYIHGTIWLYCVQIWQLFADCFQGIPPYPLYKRLALALHKSIISGTFLGTRHNMASDVQESSLKEEENGWQKLISEKGSELLNVEYNWPFWFCLFFLMFSVLRAAWLISEEKLVACHQMLKAVDFELHVQEPFFSQLKGNYFYKIHCLQAHDKIYNFYFK